MRTLTCNRIESYETKEGDHWEDQKAVRWGQLIKSSSRCNNLHKTSIQIYPGPGMLHRDYMFFCSFSEWFNASNRALFCVSFRANLIVSFFVIVWSTRTDSIQTPLIHTLCFEYRRHKTWNTLPRIVPSQANEPSTLTMARLSGSIENICNDFSIPSSCLMLILMARDCFFAFRKDVSCLLFITQVHV